MQRTYFSSFKRFPRLALKEGSWGAINHGIPDIGEDAADVSLTFRAGKERHAGNVTVILALLVLRYTPVLENCDCTSTMEDDVKWVA